MESLSRAFFVGTSFVSSARHYKITEFVHFSEVNENSKAVVFKLTSDTHKVYLPGSGSVSPGSAADTRNDNGEAIDIVVYFCDKSGILLKCPNGQNMEAGALFEMVLEDLLDVNGLTTNAVESARELFSLWLVSDLLELQLKPNHIPFKLVCFWEELLDKYANASEENKQRDEPVIMFRRNVFYDKKLEKEIEDTRLLQYLYHEAKKNVVDGRYPLQRSECEDLAVIQAVIKTKEAQSNTTTDQETNQFEFGSTDYFKSTLREYLPVSFCKRNLIFQRNKNPEFQLAEKYNNESKNLPVGELYKKYLDKCRPLPFYGSAFFRGQAEHPGKKVDDPVWVAVNVEGVSIIDLDDQVLLLSIRYESLSWQFAESSSAAAENSETVLPCLFLSFPQKDDNGDKLTRLLQIFSREALLADNLIEACVTLKKTLTASRPQDSGQSGGDVVDGPTQGTDEIDGVKTGVGDISKMFQKLALITFQDGKRVDASSNVRQPKQAKNARTSTANV